MDEGDGLDPARAGRFQPAGAGIGPAVPDHLMPGGQQFGKDSGADEAGRAGQKDTHVRSSL